MSDHILDLPFSAEYAKSNRAGCKACSGNIGKDTLRLAVMVQSPHFDGKVPNWFHFDCFWKRARVKNYLDIHGFNALRWEDQEKIKAKLGGPDAAADTVSCKVYKDFTAEYAKSNRSTCRGCNSTIQKDEVRLSIKDYVTQRAKMYGPQDLWHHVDCFVAKRDELEFTSDMDPTKITGFSYLRKEDKDLLREKLGKGDKKKRKATGSSSSTPSAKKSKQETDEEKALKEQNELLWQYRDALHNDVSLDALRALLEYNNQQICSGESKLLDSVSDAMAFGALEPCPECGTGQLTFSDSSNGYRCTGDITEWTKCLYFTISPKRRPFKVPEEFHDVAFLKNYKFVKRDRMLPKISATVCWPEASASSCTLPSATALDSSKKPLAGMRFAVIGKTSRKKADTSKMLSDLGGQLVTVVDSKLAACISTKGEVEKMGKGMKLAKSGDIFIVGETFLDAVLKSTDAASKLIQQHSIAPWGSYHAGQLTDHVDGVSAKSPPTGAFKSLGKSMVSSKDEAMFTKSVPATMKMTVKGGAAVDAESGLETKAHVLQGSKSEVYNVVLGLVDILRGTNSYYKLQLLESDKGNKWWLFRAWGRVGTTIGGNKLETFGSKASAIAAFFALYLDKTGNEWTDRVNFKKIPSKFYPVDIDYGADDDIVCQLDAAAGSNSRLPASIQDLIRLIFDVESMKKAMLEFEIDLKKMPLGRLSKKQIANAYKVLSELQQLMEKNGTATQFLDASNRFYTLIPHDFGMKKPPLLDSVDSIKNKTEMLDNLLDIEIAYNLLKSSEGGDKDPIDMHYEKLKTGIEVLDKTCDEYERLVSYVANTHAATHQQYDLQVLDVFKVERDGESKSYRPFRDLHNRKLLWHGSRRTNFAGILSQGLRIAPPEAPVTGYMFGKGLYFADMVSKSANYCHTSKSDPVGLLLLCEVALGNIHELTHAEFITKLPKGKHSTKGCGMTGPDPRGSFATPDGVDIPMGKGVNTCVANSSLLYNEYIVYDVAQVNLKYLLKVNFKYKY